MTTAQQIRINQLLLEREALWARIHACEQEASRLLGSPYPFVRPSLPSDHRAKRRAGSTRKASEAAPKDEAPGLASAPRRDPLRRLELEESCFQVRYRHLGHEFTEEHRDPEALRVLLRCQTRNLSVLRIVTLNTRGEEQAVLLDTAE